MSAIQKINNSGLSLEEKDNLKALIGINVEIKNQIIEDDQVTDNLLRKYLRGNISFDFMLLVNYFITFLDSFLL